MPRDHVDRPYVAIKPEGRYTCLVLFRGTKYAYHIEYDRGIRVNKTRLAKFDEEFAVAHPYVAGKPDATKTYNVQDAARRYLNWGSYAGITEVAERALQTLIQSNGESDMSVIEGQVANQTDSRVPAKTEVEKAVKASTKNSTTADAKKPSKAQVTKKDAKPAAKKDAKPAAKKSVAKKDAKPAAKKDAKPAAKKDAKPAAKKANGESKAGGTGRLDPNMRIQVLVESNPRREGGQGFENWPKIAKANGKTIEAYLKAGGGMSYLRTDIERGHVKLVK